MILVSISGVFPALDAVQGSLGSGGAPRKEEKWIVCHSEAILLRLQSRQKSKPRVLVRNPGFASKSMGFRLQPLFLTVLGYEGIYIYICTHDHTCIGQYNHLQYPTIKGV